MDNQQPKVSIIIACYNQGKYLDEAVHSVLNQTYQDFEIIIVNDGSTDEETIEILENYQKPKARIINTDNQGVACARNNGIREAKGQYILPLDADDKIETSYLEKAVKILDDNLNIGIVYCETEFFGLGIPKVKFDLPNYSFTEILLKNLIPNTAFFRKADWEEVGGYNHNMVYGWEDYDLWLSILEIGREVFRIPEVLFYYRQQAFSRSKIANQHYLDSYRTIFENHHELYSKNINIVFNHMIDLQHQVEQSQDQLQQTQAAFAQSQSQLEYLQAQLQQTQAAFAQSQSQLEYLQAQLQQTQAAFARSQSQLEDSQAQLEHTQAARERAQAQLQRTQTELGLASSKLIQAQALISGMESSKFWKVRTAWFKIKGRLNLVSESEEIYKPNFIASLSSNDETLPETPENISKMFAFISGCPGDAYRYRCHHQAEMLKFAGYEVDVYECMVFPYEELLKKYRVIVAHRVPYTYEFEQFVSKANKLGIRVIFDTDDLIFDPSLLYQIDAYVKMDDQEKALYEDGVKRYRKTLALCEGVVVTTDKLKQEVEKNFPNKPVFISRNRISSEMEQEAIKAQELYSPDERILRIAYFSGTRTHAKDFAECVPALKNILREFPQVRLMVVGHLDIPEELQGLSSKIEVFPFLFWKDLPGLYRSKVSINLAPLESNNDFTESKSELKYFEAGLLSVPTVASDVGAFRIAIKNGVNGFLCSNPIEWENALRELVTNRKLRQEIGQRAFEDVNSRYLTRAATSESVQVWQKLLNGSVLPNQPLSIAFVLRAPIAQTGGGYKQIFYLAHYLAEQGHDVNIYVEPIAHLTGFTPEQVQKFCEENFGKSKAIIHCGHAGIVESDVAIATNWPTAYVVDKLVNTRFKAYFIQDYEPYFYEPDDACFLQAEATYDLPLGMICIGKYLSQVLSKRNRIQYPYIDFSLNEAFLAKEPGLTRHSNPERPCSILFFARPNLPRRNFAVGVEALDKLHQQNPDVQINLYGMEEAIDLPFPYKNLGILTQSEAAEAMRSADIHLSFSLTNISAVVFEAMACGCATVEADVPPVQAMVENGETCLLNEPNSQAVFETLMTLVNNPELRQKIAKAGYDSVKKLTIENMCFQFEQLLRQYSFRSSYIKLDSLK